MVSSPPVRTPHDILNPGLLKLKHRDAWLQFARSVVGTRCCFVEGTPTSSPLSGETKSPRTM